MLQFNVKSSDEEGAGNLFRNLRGKSASKHFIEKSLPLLLGLISGFSVFFFLYFFGAYGIQKGQSYSGHSHLFRSISFGVLTFFYLAVLEGLVRPRLKLNSLKARLFWYAIMILIGSQLIFILFNFFWNWQEWDAEAYLLIQKEFPLMMVLPLSFYLVLKKLITKNKTVIDFLLFCSENGKDQLKIRLRDFLFANASENYVTIVYMSGETTRRHLIRKPLKVLEDELGDFPEIVRSHRSYLVNRHNIQNIRQVKGKVQLEFNDDIVPVSGSFRDEFIG